MVACVLYVLTRLRLDLTAYPKLDAWLIASINRPAAQVARKLRETSGCNDYPMKTSNMRCSFRACFRARRLRLRERRLRWIKNDKRQVAPNRNVSRRAYVFEIGVTAT